MPQRQLQPVEATLASVLSVLRSRLPSHTVTFAEGLRTAERLAALLLELYAIETLPIPTAMVSNLPHLRLVVDRDMPSLTSGSSLWDATQASWLITLNGREPVTRQRFTVFHEFFHIVVHHAAQAGLFARLSGADVERIADYFAGCVLIPKRFLTRAWCAGTQDVDELAALFGASAQAIQVRLQQARLVDVDLVIIQGAA